MYENIPSYEFIDYICRLYGDIYDDRIEDCSPPTAGEALRAPGEDWVPGQKAGHKSLIVFQRELEEMGIRLSTSKLRKVLVTGGCWSTIRSREIIRLYEQYTSPVSDGGPGLSGDAAVKRIAVELKVSTVTISVNLPYRDVVYNLEKKSGNARRCERWRRKKYKI